MLRGMSPSRLLIESFFGPFMCWHQIYYNLFVQSGMDWATVGNIFGDKEKLEFSYQFMKYPKSYRKSLSHDEELQSMEFSRLIRMYIHRTSVVTSQRTMTLDAKLLHPLQRVNNTSVIDKSSLFKCQRTPKRNLSQNFSRCLQCPCHHWGPQWT